MKDEVTFPLILYSHKYIKSMQISLGREIYKAVGRIKFFLSVTWYFWLLFFC